MDDGRGLDTEQPGHLLNAKTNLVHIHQAIFEAADHAAIAAYRRHAKPSARPGPSDRADIRTLVPPEGEFGPGRHGVPLIVLAVAYARHTWGPGRLWVRLPFVQRHRWMI
ncbi:hypothetical protein Pth03_63530 [Planotetraspora thailandica]|uniref:Uncharacterized protein n=1 Tax=Planotetraspora thailandica TaxID=487172 RepID=A0A8J3XYH2_9ACTN|nr:hypothetical protein Pth03_63530 [Planotetraspora thailandica]